MKSLSKILLAVCLSVLLVGSATAIDKSKKADKKSKSDTAVVNKTKQEKPKSPESTKKADPPKSQKTYDKFVDRNNNGIDDRAEKNTPQKQTKKKDPPSKPTKKKPDR